MKMPKTNNPSGEIKDKITKLLGDYWIKTITWTEFKDKLLSDFETYKAENIKSIKEIKSCYELVILQKEKEIKELKGNG